MRNVFIPSLIWAAEPENEDKLIVSGYDYLSDIIPTALLYWDRTVIAAVSNPMLGPVAETVEYLHSLNVADYFYVDENSSIDMIRSTQLQSEVYKEISSENDVEFSILFPDLSDFGVKPEAKSLIKDAARTQLYNKGDKNTFLFSSIVAKLPVPKRDVQYEDLLAFKMKRIDEVSDLLNEIRIMSSVYLDGLNFESALRQISERIDKKIAAVDKVMQESWPESLKKNLTFSSVVGGATSLVNPLLDGEAYTPSITVGALAGFLTFVASSLKPSEISSPYVFASEVKNLR